MSALGLVGYGYDEEEDDDEEEEEDDALADALNRDRERPDGTAEKPISAAELDRDRTEDGGAYMTCRRCHIQSTSNLEPFPRECAGCTRAYHLM